MAFLGARVSNDFDPANPLTSKLLPPKGGGSCAGLDFEAPGGNDDVDDDDEEDMTHNNGARMNSKNKQAQKTTNQYAPH